MLYYIMLFIDELSSKQAEQAH